MLYSPTAHVAFAHYPKTAGCSLFHWFTTVLPDALHLDAAEPHMNVRRGLQHLGIGEPRASQRWRRPLDWLTARNPFLAADRSAPRIIGVLREPFEMLVSLYEFWQQTPAALDVPPFIATARNGTFRDFVWMAVLKKELVRYEDFFDVGGPAWEHTRLIDFHSLEAGLAAVSAEFGIPGGQPLERINAGGGRKHSLREYRASVATMVMDIRRHFRWYYEHGVRLMVRGPAPRRVAA